MRTFKTCPACDEEFYDCNAREDKQYCSAKCRQSAKRASDNLHQQYHKISKALVQYQIVLRTKPDQVDYIRTDINLIIRELNSVIEMLNSRDGADNSFTW